MSINHPYHTMNNPYHYWTNIDGSLTCSQVWGTNKLNCTMLRLRLSSYLDHKHKMPAECDFWTLSLHHCLTCLSKTRDLSGYFLFMLVDKIVWIVSTFPCWECEQPSLTQTIAQCRHCRAMVYNKILLPIQLDIVSHFSWSFTLLL